MCGDCKAGCISDIGVQQNIADGAAQTSSDGAAQTSSDVVVYGLKYYIVHTS